MYSLQSSVRYNRTVQIVEKLFWLGFFSSTRLDVRCIYFFFWYHVWCDGWQLHRSDRQVQIWRQLPSTAALMYENKGKTEGLEHTQTHTVEDTMHLVYARMCTKCTIMGLNIVILGVGTHFWFVVISDQKAKVEIGIAFQVGVRQCTLVCVHNFQYPQLGRAFVMTPVHCPVSVDGCLSLGTINIAWIFTFILEKHNETLILKR